MAEVPMLLDLIATVLESGAPVATAVTTVADAARDAAHSASANDPSDVLLRVGKLLTLGADAHEAWQPCLRHPALRPLATHGVRCATSGARMAAALRMTASRLRADRRAGIESAAARLGVWSMLPLGLCFLPAFVCMGIVPTLVGLGRQALGP